MLLESAGFRPYWKASESAVRLQERQVRLNESLAQLNGSQLEKVITLFDVPRKILPAPESATGTIGEAIVQIAVQRGEKGIEELEQVLQSTRLLASGNTEQRILEACLKSQANASEFVDEVRVAELTGLSLKDLRYCLVSMQEDGLVSLVRGVDGYKILITAQGRLSLRSRYLTSELAIGGGYVKIVPKGLRSFDADDADFFLELLPGPRRDGLPESIHFWKFRIEETDAGQDLHRGRDLRAERLRQVVPGQGRAAAPAGRGRAPGLHRGHAGETEARLLKGLRKAFPDLPTDLGLVDSLSAVCRDWARSSDEESPHRPRPVRAMAPCRSGRRGHGTGRRPAAMRRRATSRRLVMVRDDFWMAPTRFMRDAGDRPCSRSQNVAAVDLFDLRHARKVLMAFGQAYGTLPEDRTAIRPGQQTFLDQAIAGLAQDGRIISVRLALFAEMVKGKPWTPATLREVGGTEGVGVTFLEETFGSPRPTRSIASTRRRPRRVLKALLPESGTDIKGQMRSHEELLEASGYADRPRDFDDLIRILDPELRLITPTDPEGIRRLSGTEPGPPGGQLLPTDARLPRALAAGLADPQAAGDPPGPGRAEAGGTRRRSGTPSPRTATCRRPGVGEHPAADQEEGLDRAATEDDEAGGAGAWDADAGTGAARRPILGRDRSMALTIRCRRLGWSSRWPRRTRPDVPCHRRAICGLSPLGESAADPNDSGVERRSQGTPPCQPGPAAGRCRPGRVPLPPAARPARPSCR